MTREEEARRIAVDKVFERLPKVFRTAEVKAEIADKVARSEDDYERAALLSVIGMFTSIDRALQTSDRNRVLSLSSFLKNS